MLTLSAKVGRGWDLIVNIVLRRCLPLLTVMVDLFCWVAVSLTFTSNFLLPVCISVYALNTNWTKYLLQEMASVSPDDTKPDMYEERFNNIVYSGVIALGVGLGHRVGLFKALTYLPEPETSQSIAEHAGLNERYIPYHYLYRSYLPWRRTF